MREIKFRQFHNGIWHYWGFIDGAFIGPDASWSKGATSQQFTGRYDCRENPIYEGDIVKLSQKIEDERSDIPDENEVIEWNESSAGFNCCISNLYQMMDENVVEVIGNVHQHHELLKD